MSEGEWIVAKWILGIISGLVVLAIAGLLRDAISKERRLTALESDRDHIRELVEEKLERLTEKIERLPRGRGSHTP